MRFIPVVDDHPEAKTTMPILTDQVLTECADQAYEGTRLGRNGAHTTREAVSAELLAQLEASGDAMRFVNAKGRIAWKASPRFREHLNDLELDAQGDLEDV
jgi:hypothetical protein